MIVHDARLNLPRPNGRPVSLRPPKAENVWTVSYADSISHIIGWVRVVAKAKSGTGRLDALHFMAHGNSARVQLGSEGLTWANLDVFQNLAGCVRTIVFFSCLVGAEQALHADNYQLTFGNAVAAHAQCKVVVCKMTQYAFIRGNEIDMGAFEGPVYVYPAGGRGAPRSYNYSPRSEVDLNHLIFGV